jgi:Protein of unknown function (DUF4089)
MTDAQTLAYVKAASAALGISLDDARAQRVASHLLRTADMASLLEQVELGPEDELAEIYKPNWPPGPAVAG